MKVSFAYLSKRKSIIEILESPKAFIDYSQIIDNVYENLEDCNIANNRRVLVMFNAYMESNKNFSAMSF